MRLLSWPVAALILTTAMTSGCVSMQPTMTNFSVDYNRVIADTRNRMILLNIVRSAYREPTYYTAFSQIEGSVNLQANVGGTIADLAGGAATAFTPTVGGSFTNAPTFTIVPLNSEEFSKGMLAPIDPDTIRLFLSQGWRTKFLAPLLVQKVECIYDDQVVAEIENEPGRDFGQVTPQNFAEIEFYTGKVEANPAYRLTVSSEEALRQITGGGLDKFDIRLGEAAHDQTRSAISFSALGSPELEARVPDQFRSECLARFKTTLDTHAELKRQVALSATQLATLATRSRVSAGGRTAPSALQQLALNIVFRSPDGIVYYLGERLRAKLEGRLQAEDGDGDRLFDIERNAAGPAAVAVAHRGARWSIPALEIEPAPQTAGLRRPIDRSLEVLALLNQLISVQTSLKEFSRAPSSVRVR